MEIVVGVKPAPEAESRLRATEAGRELDPSGVKFVLAGYDESAVEQALLLRQEIPGTKVHAYAVGPATRTDEVLRSALALGCDTATAVELDAPPLEDPVRIARAFAAALALRSPPADLLLFGKQAGDDEESVVGSAVAETLGIAYVGGVVDLRYQATTARFAFRRPTEACEERWEAPGPLAVGLQQAWNDPRTATLPAILRSRKAPIARGPASVAPPASVAERFALPPPRQGAKMIEYRTPPEAAEKLVKLLREEAKVFP